jgi:hypothetical protein
MLRGPAQTPALFVCVQFHEQPFMTGNKIEEPDAVYWNLRNLLPLFARAMPTCEE